MGTGKPNICCSPVGAWAEPMVSAHSSHHVHVLSQARHSTGLVTWSISLIPTKHMKKDHYYSRSQKRTLGRVEVK